MRARAALAAAVAALGLAGAAPSFAAGDIKDDPESRRLALECLLKAAERLPKIYSFKVVSESMDQHGDRFDGTFFVTVLHRNVFYDFQCSTGNVTDTDLTGKSTTMKRVDKVWVNLRTE